MKKAVIHTLFGLKYEITYERYGSNAHEHSFYVVKGTNGYYDIELKTLILPVMNTVIEFISY